MGAWFLVISGITTLLIAANRRKSKHVCTEVLVGIKGSGEHFYINREDIMKLLQKSLNGPMVQKPVDLFNLQNLERLLETNPWIKNAELYFDSRDALHLMVEEREPIARVFTNSGTTFYMDSSGHRMPLLEDESIRLPVITGMTGARKLRHADSAQIEEAKQVAWFIYNNKFWNAQIGQIIITPDQTFELVPVIGDHIIRIGDAENIDRKLARVYVFYQQVMTKTGFNKYAALDARFDGQIVTVKKGSVSSVDSIQLQRNIDALMNRAALQNIEAEMLPGESNR
ncbi:MAG: cell division protein FtsQ/DivIB [Flavisolibacter sp.]